MPISHLLSVLLVVGVTAQAAAQRPDRSCRGSAFVTDSGVGALRLGLSVATVRERCIVYADTSLVNHDFVEMERVLLVRIGRDTIRAAVSHDGVIDRIDVDTPHLQTRDGVRVGRTLRSLLNRRVTGGVSEATVGIALPGHCGLRFVLAGEPSDLEQGRDLAYQDLRRFPVTTRVARIQIVGCR
jgi:hypothetical protein